MEVVFINLLEANSNSFLNCVWMAASVAPLNWYESIYFGFNMIKSNELFSVLAIIGSGTYKAVKVLIQPALPPWHFV